MLEKIKRAGGRTIWPSNQNGRDGKPARVAGQPNKQPATGSPRAPPHLLQKNPQRNRLSRGVTEHYYTRDKLCTKDPGYFCLHNGEVPTLPCVRRHGDQRHGRLRWAARARYDGGKDPTFAYC